MQSVNRLIETLIPKSYQLTLTINRPERTFTGTVIIVGTAPRAGQVSLHAKDLTITDITLNGQATDFTTGLNDEITIEQSVKANAEAIITVSYSGNITDAMHGLYPCYFEVDGVKKELLATQFESHHAREVFPCIDEPEAKATFELTLETETDVTVLANMPIKHQVEHDGILETTFDQTPRMSSYLLAFVIGDLQKKSAQTSSGVEVNVYATDAQSANSLDFALDHAVKSIEFFNDYFGTAYPLPKSDHVALPDFSSGAMENWGLITYREIALLADPKTTTITSKRYIATVISHELSHQWFGNLVTMRWWNDLWLNESFATIMEYIAVDAIHPEWDAWLDFAANESILALRRDAIDGVQPVRVAVHHPDEISTLFDGAIVYAKGARLLKMCRDFVGESAFQSGLKAYFQQFAYQNTTADDLWQCLSDASKKDVGSFMNPWLNQSGYPVLSVESDRIAQQQFFIGPHHDSSQLWPIPLDSANSEDTPQLLETRELVMEIAANERFNTHGSGHYLTKYSSDHLLDLLKTISQQSNITRMQLLNEQTILARGGVVSSAGLIDILDNYRDESNDNVWAIIATTISELKKFVETDDAAQQALRYLAGTIAKQQFERLGWEAAADEDENDTKLRTMILGQMIYSEQEDIIARCRQLYGAGIETINPEQRALVISAVVRNSTDTATVRELLVQYRTTNSADLREDICIGITSTRDTQAITLILHDFTDRATIKPQDLFRFFAYMIRNRYARSATWQWLVDNWSYIEQNFAGDKSYDDFPRYAAMGLVNRQQLQDYRDFFTPLRDDPSLRRNIDIGITEIEGRIALLERDSASVTQKLKSLPQPQ